MLLPWGTMYGDISGYRELGLERRVGARDAAKPPPMQRTALVTKGHHPECQQCCSWESPHRRSYSRSVPMDRGTCCSRPLREAEKRTSEQLSPGDTLGALDPAGPQASNALCFSILWPHQWGPYGLHLLIKFPVTFNSSKQRGGHMFFSLLYRCAVPAQRACPTGPRSHSKLMVCANWYLLNDLIQDKLYFYIKANTASRSRMPSSW